MIRVLGLGIRFCGSRLRTAAWFAVVWYTVTNRLEYGDYVGVYIGI